MTWSPCLQLISVKMFSSQRLSTKFLLIQRFGCSEPTLLRSQTRRLVVIRRLVLIRVSGPCPCRCHQRFRSSSSLGSYCSLLSDVVPDVPPDLLGSLLHEELTEQRDRLRFSDRTTGGALAFVPFSRSGGCLVCPGGPGLDRLRILQIDSSVRTSSQNLNFLSLKETFC